MFDETPSGSAPSPAPATAPQPMMATPQPAMPPVPPVMAQQPRKSRKGLIAALVVVFFIFALAGGASAYYFLVYSQDPELVLSKSMLAMSKLESASFDVSAQVAGEARDEEGDARDVVAVVTIKGNGELTEKGNGTTTVSFSATSGSDKIGPFGGELRQADGVTYLNLSDFAFPALQGMDLSPVADVITDRWIEVDVERLTDMVGMGEIMNKIEEKQAEQEQKYGAQVQEALREYLPTFFTITDTLDKETVNGVKTHHFAYEVNEDAVRSFFGRLQEIVGEEFDGAFDKQVEDVNAFLDGVDNLHGEMWIGTSDSYLYKLTLLGEALPPEASENDAPLQISVTALMGDFNEPVTVDAPADATPVEEMVGEVMDVIMATAQQRAADMRSDADADGLVLMQEEQCGTDPANPDSDGDGFTDGQEVDGGYSPVGPGEMTRNGIRMYGGCP